MNKLTRVFIVLSSTFLYALLSPLLKKTNLTFQPFTIMAFSMFSLFIFSLVMSIAFEHSTSINISKERNTILILLGVGIINGIGFWLGIKAYQYMSLSEQSLFSILSPIFISVLAFLILGEKINPKIFVSLVIMAIGLIYSLI